MKLELSRRKFLAAAAGSAAVLPFLRSLPGYSQESDKRFLILAFSGNGRVRHSWGADALGPERGNLQFRQTLQPLTPYKDYVTVVRGLMNGVAVGIGGTHEGGMQSLWTGVDSPNSGPSIDQIVGLQCGGGSRPSLDFRVLSNEDELNRNPNNRMVYDTAGTAIDPKTDPLVTADQIFGGLNLGDGPDPAIERARLMRETLFQRLDSELADIQPRLCAEDRAHLDALRAGWADVEQRLVGPVLSDSCRDPEVSSLLDPTNYFRQESRRAIELLVFSMACDLSRVASLQWSQARSDLVASWLGQNVKQHDASHQVPQPFALSQYLPPPENRFQDFADNPTPAMLAQYASVWAPLQAVEAFYAEEFAYLLKRLSEFPVAGGGTLLDQSMVVWGSEVDNGSAHDHFSMPFVVAGGGGGRLNRGQVLNYPAAAGLTEESKQLPPGGHFHNDLLVTIGQVMGCPISSIGPSAFNRGPLTELMI
jgi:hypothetical protein